MKVLSKTKKLLLQNNSVFKLQQQRRLQKIIALGKPIKIHLGCGQDYLPGYVNIDAYPGSKADLVMDATKLDLFPDNCADVIESYHFFEHLMFHKAKQMINEWFRILSPGGLVIIELPNLEVCIKEVGKHFTDDSFDLAMGGIFGQAPGLIEKEGVTQLHKWGWTPKTLKAELSSAGFTNIHQHRIKQSWRKAAAFGRDMQIRAVKPDLVE